MESFLCAQQSEWIQNNNVDGEKNPSPMAEEIPVIHHGGTQIKCQPHTLAGEPNDECRNKISDGGVDF